MAPEIDVMMNGPSRKAVGLGRSCRAGLAEVRDEVEERGTAVAQVAGLRRPVVHLHIDVCGVVAAPGRDDTLAPDALQVCRLCARPGTADQEVSAVMKVESGERRIRPARESGATHVSG